MAQYFLSAEKKSCQPRILDPMKTSVRNEGNLKCSKMKENSENLSLADLPWKSGKRKLLKQKGNMKDEILEHQGGKKTIERVKIWIDIISVPS